MLFKTGPTSGKIGKRILFHLKCALLYYIRFNNFNGSLGIHEIHVRRRIIAQPVLPRSAAVYFRKTWRYRTGQKKTPRYFRTWWLVRRAFFGLPQISVHIPLYIPLYVVSRTSEAESRTPRSNRPRPRSSLEQHVRNFFLHDGPFKLALVPRCKLRSISSEIPSYFSQGSSLIPTRISQFVHSASLLKQK